MDVAFDQRIDYLKIDEWIQAGSIDRVLKYCKKLKCGARQVINTWFAAAHNSTGIMIGKNHYSSEVCSCQISMGAVDTTTRSSNGYKTLIYNGMTDIMINIKLKEQIDMDYFNTFIITEYDSYVGTMVSCDVHYKQEVMIYNLSFSATRLEGRWVIIQE